ncbi:hypothetical protein [Brevundimonas sp.]
MVATLGLACAAPATAQQRVSIGNFTSAQSCETYVLTSGSVAASGSHTRVYGVGSHTSARYSASWRQDLVRDCTDNFPGLRAAITSALAASGRVEVVPRGTRGAIVLNGQVSDVGTSYSSVSTQDMDRSGNDAGLTVDLSLQEPGGSVRFGALIAKRVSMGSDFATEGFSSTASQSTTSVYNSLQRELALAVSRAVNFELDPLTVISVSGRRARVSYGAPLLTLGATVIVDGGVERGQIRCNVVSAGNGFADIEAEGGQSLENILPGSRAQFAEPEDPASNGRRLQRVNLP